MARLGEVEAAPVRNVNITLSPCIQYSVTYNNKLQLNIISSSLFSVELEDSRLTKVVLLSFILFINC